MALNLFISLSIWLATMPLSIAQSLTGISTCNGENAATAFPQCNSLYSTLTICAGPSVATGAPYIACMCNQALFNNYYGCESEYRLCFDDDSQDLPIENQLEIWHSICDSRLTFSLTTPVVSNIITSFHPNFCNTAVSACDSGILSQSECSETYAGHGSASAFSSCLCQPKLLSLAYTCNVLGNISCQLTPGAVTNMPQYKLCTNLLEVLGTAPASTLANTTSASSPPSSISSSTSTPSTSIPSTSVSSTNSPPQASPTVTVVQTTLQGAPPPVATTSNTITSLAMRKPLKSASSLCFTLLMALLLCI